MQGVGVAVVVEGVEEVEAAGVLMMWNPLQLNLRTLI